MQTARFRHARSATLSLYPLFTSAKAGWGTVSVSVCLSVSVSVPPTPTPHLSLSLQFSSEWTLEQLTDSVCRQTDTVCGQFYSPLNCCLTAVLSLEIGSYPDNLYVLCCHIRVFFSQPFMCLDLVLSITKVLPMKYKPRSPVCRLYAWKTKTTQAR